MPWYCFAWCIINIVYMIVYEALGEQYVKAIFHDDGVDASFHHA